ncbi:MAG: TauD/TfdA family dioxygenase [Rhodospirillales bacterium]|jgi:hypothetical protein|nr:TauD/TfdA family dioxygenase [Rhodospirillales bacterium]MBT4040421.1 TauD/TfdA family dioxygenase [Rhodospirillales bacterium]MBT4626486.1 TauD/TfdA family dioxygenase [Rhodospirillales bacterium]MBT5350363.1 TauD/TfdA family dioxygenase [Rhodospirillales bacterium]MBT5521776.1 TauD/TfdA family dioxygenase [Rhodospirillales bacterium]
MPTNYPTIPACSHWRGTDFHSKDDVAVDLDAALVQDSLAEIRAVAAKGHEVTSLAHEDVPMKAFSEPMAALRDEILHGRGFAILRGFPVDELNQTEIETMYWALGLHLGLPVSQSVMGDRLGHVVDVSGRDPNARAYRNSKELTPHTDPADILAFLCLKPAMRGGISHFSSSHTVHEVMRQTRPDLLERLYKGYHYHRFGEQPEGFDPITPHRVPVFSQREGLLSCRIVRQYIEIAADEYPEHALDDLDREALDMFEDLAAQDNICFKFTLEPGEAIIANNYTVLHARTAFDDHEDLALRRHLLRLWLLAENPRPTVPEVYIYGDGEPGIPPKPGHEPIYKHNITIQ